MAGKRIVVIGGGFGGAMAASTARKLLTDEHTVTLVDRTDTSHLCGSFPLLIVGERDLTNVTRSLTWLDERGVERIQAEVESIDTDGKTITTSSGTLEYDYLVLSPGAVYDWEAVPGSAEAHSFYNLETAERLRDALDSFTGGRIVLAVASMPYKCPPAPFETAMVMESAFQNRGVRSDVEIHVYTPEPSPLLVAGPEAGKQLISDMEGRGIHVHTNAAITAVGDGREANFSDGSSLDADLIITVPTHRAPDLVGEAGLLGPSGWIPVDAHTLQTKADGVYAIGDVNAVMMANGRPIPKAGVFASAEGETVAVNIAAEINDSQSEAFPGAGYCFILYGNNQAGMIRGDFLEAGRPNVSIVPPSSEGYSAKEQFEESWREFRI